MRIFIFLVIGVVAGAGVLFAISDGKAKGEVLGWQIIKPTPTPYEGTATPPAKPDPALQDTPTPSAGSQEINEFIERFAAQYGVDPNKVRYTAVCESGFNPGAINGSYLGLFQFAPVAWQTYRNRMGEDADIALRANAEAAVETAAYIYSVNAAGIWPHCVPAKSN